MRISTGNFAKETKRSQYWRDISKTFSVLPKKRVETIRHQKVRYKDSNSSNIGKQLTATKDNCQINPQLEVLGNPGKKLNLFSKSKSVCLSFPCLHPQQNDNILFVLVLSQLHSQQDQLIQKLLQYHMEQYCQQENRTKPLFYFRFEMRLEFIPFIEQEICQFISFAEEKVGQIEHVPLILRIVNKKLKSIDSFYDENWSDYRAQLILRSRQLLVQFCKRNHQKLSQRIVKNNNQQGSQISPSKEPEKFVESKVKQKQIIKTPVRQIVKPRAVDSGKNQSKNSNSASRSFSKDQIKLVPKQVNVSPMNSSPIRQSPRNNIKLSSSRQKQITSPAVVIKKVQSPVQKKQPQRKLTKEEYIAYLRNKKTS